MSPFVVPNVSGFIDPFNSSSGSASSLPAPRGSTASLSASRGSETMGLSTRPLSKPLVSSDPSTRVRESVPYRLYHRSAQLSASSSQAEADICRMSASEFSRYQITPDVLGKGAFGIVRVGINQDTGERVAIKAMKKSGISERALANISKECSILSRLDHPNVIKVHGGYDDGANIYWVLSLMRGGEVFEAMVKRAAPFSESTSRNIFRQLVAAVSYCHSKNIIHRDIKLENLLFRDACPDLRTCTVVLSDFGLAAYQTSDGLGLIEQVGSPAYVAPEIVRGYPYQGRETDIWAMGVALYAMMYAQFPFDGDDIETIFEAIITYEPYFPPGGFGDVQNLIKGMLQKNPIARLAMFEIEQHPWVVGL